MPRPTFIYDYTKYQPTESFIYSVCVDIPDTDIHIRISNIYATSYEAAVSKGMKIVQQEIRRVPSKHWCYAEQEGRVFEDMGAAE